MIDCEAFSSIPNRTAGSDINGWVCGNSGEHLSCPVSSALVGVCGSGSKEDCKLNCENPSAAAILCSPPQSPYGVSKDSTWMLPQDQGDTGKCPKGTVSCGACSSQAGSDCDGKSTRLECCPFMDCSPTSNEGFWRYVKSGSTAGETLTISYGIDVDASYELTKSLSQTYSASVSRGFTFKKDEKESSRGIEVEAEYATEVTSSVSASFQVSVGATTTASCDFAPYVLWQFEMQSYGACPATTYTDAFACTKTAALKPCCLPGYSLNPTYSECVPDSPNLCNSTFIQIN